MGHQPGVGLPGEDGGVPLHVHLHVHVTGLALHEGKDGVDAGVGPDEASGLLPLTRGGEEEGGGGGGVKLLHLGAGQGSGGAGGAGSDLDDMRCVLDVIWECELASVRQGDRRSEYG